MTVHSGSCHCGAISFRIDAEIVELTTCDCSLCVKKNARMTMVHESALTTVKGEDALTLYQWNTRRAKHYFCKHCGIYVFHRKRSLRDHFGVNVFCLDGFDASKIPVRGTEGKGMSVADPHPRAEWPGSREG